MSAPRYMQEIADKHNELFDNHKVTSVYSNDMTSGYVFDDIDDIEHKVEKIDLQEYFDLDDEDRTSDNDYLSQSLETKAYVLNELITAQNEGL
jgi:hypothetical protein